MSYLRIRSISGYDEKEFYFEKRLMAQAYYKKTGGTMTTYWMALVRNTDSKVDTWDQLCLYIHRASVIQEKAMSHEKWYRFDVHENSKK